MINTIKTIFVFALAFSLYNCGNANGGAASDNDSTATTTDSTATAVQSGAPGANGEYHFVPGKKVEGKLIALTFDDGPNHQSTPKILDTMEKEHAVGTFFVAGHHLSKKNYHYLQRAVSLGCEIANHTWEHPFLSTLSPEEQRRTINDTSNAIYEATGKYPNFFRPPYIDCDQQVFDNIPLPGVNGKGSKDWRTNMSPDDIYNSVMEKAYPGAIIVMHDFVRNTRTPEALKRIIPGLRSKGYTLVTVTDLFTSYGVTPKVGDFYMDPNTSRVPSPASTKRERSKKAGGAKAKAAK